MNYCSKLVHYILHCLLVEVRLSSRSRDDPVGVLLMGYTRCVQWVYTWWVGLDINNPCSKGLSLIDADDITNSGHSIN